MSFYVNLMILILILAHTHGDDVCSFPFLVGVTPLSSSLLLFIIIRQEEDELE